MKVSPAFTAYFLGRLSARLLALLLGAGVVPAVSAQQIATLTTLHSFTGGNDGSISQSLLVASDGSFYGTTATGGANGYGTIFKVTTAGQLTTVYTFTGGNDGAYPNPGLVQDGDGNLYGVTVSNAANSLGTIFKVTTGGACTTLHSFTNTEVTSNPVSGLVRSPDGNFYGTDGSVYRVTPAGDFTLFTNNQYVLSDGLTLGQDGNFY